MGDSHVRRIRPYEEIIRSKVVNVRLSWDFRGGSGINFIESWSQRHDPQDFDIIIIVSGGNDLDNGLEAPILVDRLHKAGEAMADAGAACVCITSIWPRSCSVFNQKAWSVHLGLKMKLRHNPCIAAWHWDRRMNFKNYDGVHLYDSGYKKAARHLISIILCMKSNYIWE